VKLGGLDISKQAVYRAVRSDRIQFGYDLPITADGDYALLLHFSDDEGTDRRVFNVVLNGEHTILANFGVARTCGYRNICNELVYFSVCNGQLRANNQVSKVQSGEIRIEFVRVVFHPLVAGIAVIKGEPGKALTIVDTKTVVFFDPKRENGCSLHTTEGPKTMHDPELGDFFGDFIV
jgi:Malectin domain